MAFSDWRTLDFDTPGAWQHAGEGRFVAVGGGELETEGGTGLLWYAPEAFDDVELEVEFRLSTPRDNSGVYLRYPDAQLRAPRPDWKRGLEVQIDELGLDVRTGQEGSALHVTGALYDRTPVLARASRPVGAWNHFHILLQQGRLRVELNTVLVCDAPVPEDAEPVGRLGLQNHPRGGAVRFRAPRVRPLR